MKRKGLFSSILMLVALVVALVSDPLHTNYAAQDVVSTNEPPILSCPTGSLLAFAKPATPTTAPTRVYIQRQDSFERQVWEVESQQVGLPAASSDGNTKVETGFVVPPLDRGRYLAWHGATNSERAADSLTFDVIPQLLAEQGIARGRPPAEVEVRVRISAAKRLRAGSSVPESVSVPITLQAQNAVAEVVSDATVRTDENGVALWRVRIKDFGIGELVATTVADQFEPTVMTVVGMPGDGESFFLALQQRERELQSVATVQNSTPRIAGIVPPRPAQVEQRAKILRNAEVSSARAAELAALAAGEPRRIGEYELQAGDVLLVLGSSIISENIRRFEQGQLGGRAGYSHASLYLGEFGGVRMVGEMWGSGFWITPLRVSVAGARVVDVYRFSQADAAKRAELARNSANAFGDASRFIRSDSPAFITRGSVLPYAFEQIGLLGLASRGSLGSLIRLTIQNVVDPFAGGKRKMICSEYVAWAYHDAGLELQVPAWRTLSDLNVLTSHERQHDYTTPNMLALSQSLSIVGRYRGP